jgi:glycosyltransferase involved in cell wall biosynthesis
MIPSAKREISMKVLHVITSLQQGGAEAMLASLIRHCSHEAEHRVFTLMNADDQFGLDPRLITEGESRRGRPSVLSLRRLMACVHEYSPDVIHGWMYHANFAAALANRRRIPLLWSIHGTALDPARSKRLTRWINRVSATLSYHAPSAIIYVSQAARELHEEQGYDPEKGVYIPNGVDLQYFDPSRFSQKSADARAGRAIRLGMVARYSPEKGHHFLIDAIAGHPLRRQIQLSFVGRGCDESGEIRSHLEREGLLQQSIISGPRTNMAEVYATFDALVIPSFSEAFPLCLLEAASMNLPVCASAVGDIPHLGLPSGFMFAPGNVTECRAALTNVLDEVMSPNRSIELRERIARRYSIEATSNQYLELYRRLVT